MRRLGSIKFRCDVAHSFPMTATPSSEVQRLCKFDGVVKRSRGVLTQADELVKYRRRDLDPGAMAVSCILGVARSRDSP
jgi:hypothetical protein